jgi:Caspase domain/Tetratricopeptide repeat
MMTRTLQMFWLFLLLLLASPSALAAKQIALVVGNNFYENFPDFRQLKKAANDAKAVGETLKSGLGFDVRLLVDGNYSDMNAAIRQVENDIEPGSVVFFYFSGHGVAVDGANYLLPSDVPQPVVGEEQRIAGSSFAAEQVISRFQKKGAKAVFAVLDACRDNPFENESGKSAGGGGGLSKMEAAEGVFILFAAGVGQTALDRLSETDTNPNSVFTRNLLPLLETDGLSQIELAKKLYSSVKKDAASVGHTQHPAYYDQIEGYITLGKSSTAAANEEPTPDEPPKQDLALNAPAEKAIRPTRLPAAEAQQKLDQIFQSSREFQASGDAKAFVAAGENALAIAAGSFGEDSVQFANANNFMVGALSAAGDDEGAIRAARRSIPIYEENFGAESAQVANEKGNLAGRLVAVKKLREAEKLYGEALQAYDKKSPGNNVYFGMAQQDFIILAHLYRGLADLRMEQGKKKEALRMSAQSNNVMKAVDDQSLMDHGSILAGHASVLLRTGDCEQARQYFAKAADAYKKAKVPLAQNAHAQAREEANKQC